MHWLFSRQPFDKRGSRILLNFPLFSLSLFEKTPAVGRYVPFLSFLACVVFECIQMYMWDRRPDLSTMMMMMMMQPVLGVLAPCPGMIRTVTPYLLGTSVRAYCSYFYLSPNNNNMDVDTAVGEILVRWSSSSRARDCRSYGSPLCFFACVCVCVCPWCTFFE